MRRVIVTDAFLEDMLAQVASEKVEAKIWGTIDLLPYVPNLGSRSLPGSIQRRYGADARKIVVSPFDVVYLATEEEDFVILGLMHERSAS